jgi:hypothetical protein
MRSQCLARIGTEDHAVFRVVFLHRRNWPREARIQFSNHSATSEAGMFSGRQSHRGNSQDPVAWVASGEETKRMKQLTKPSFLDGFVDRLQDYQFPSFLLFKLRGFELSPRWDFHPLFGPAFDGRTLPVPNPRVRSFSP